MSYVFHICQHIFHICAIYEFSVWDGRKADVEPRRLLVQRVKFAPHVVVSAGVCVGGKGHLQFVDEKAKVNAAYYLKKLLPKLVEDCA